jgi:excisionase family DNA binding protein
VSATDTPETPAQQTTLDDLPDVLTVEQAAGVYRLGRKAMYEAVARGEVPGVIRLGRSIRISKHALARQLAGTDTGGR